MASRYLAGLGLLLGECDQDLGVVGCQGLEPSDRLADRQPCEHVGRGLAGEQAQARPVRFAEGPGGIPAHGEILHGIVPAVDNSQWHQPLGCTQ